MKATVRLIYLILHAKWCSFHQAESKGDPMDDPHVRDFIRKFKERDKVDLFDKVATVVVYLLIVALFIFGG